MPSANNPLSVRAFVESVFRHKKKLLAFNVLMLALTVAIILFWPRQYRSEAKIWLKIGRENTRLDPTAATGETISIQENDREDEIKSVLDIIASRGVVDRVVEQLGPDVVMGDAALPGSEEVPEPNALAVAAKNVAGSLIDFVKQIDPVSKKEEAIQEIIENVGVDSQRKSNVVSISYDTKSPELAQAVVKELIDQYMHEHSRIHATFGSHSFFDEQQKKLKKDVAKTSAELRAAKDRVGIASIEGQRSMLENQLQSVQQSKMDNLQALSQSKAKLAALEDLIDDEPESVTTGEKSVPNTGRDMIRAQLYTLQVERMEMEARMRDHPKLDAIKKQEADAREELAKKSEESRIEVTKEINQIRQTLMMEFAQEKAQSTGLAAVKKSLTEQETEIRKQMSQLNGADIEVSQLQREVELAVTNYRKYAENVEDARIGEALDSRAVSNISVAQLPTLEEKPLSPSKILVALLGLMTMFFGSIAIAIGMQMLDNTMHGPLDVGDVVEAPVLVSVPDRRQYRHVLKS